MGGRWTGGGAWLGCGAAVLVAALVLPGMATAQSVAQAEQCVKAHRSAPAAAAAERCTDQLYKGCLGSNPAPTTLEYATCAQKTHEAWDGLLNKLWQPVKAQAQQNGTWDKVLGQQRKWLAGRDAKCQAEYASYEGGSLAPVAYSHCMASETAERATGFYHSLGR